MIIKILGSGCPKCRKLEENAKQAVKNLGIQAEVDHIKDLASIMEYGVMRTPGLVVDEKVVAMGKVTKVEEIEKILKIL